MKIVMTLLVRDEADIVDSQLAYHLNAGVDFVVATDHDSQDGTTEILESYARQGLLHLIRERGEVQESGWRTRMARMAATDFGADWVINTDTDEFWLPREGTLKDVFAAVPEEFGVIWALTRPFVLRPDDGRSFAERMIVCVTAGVAVNDPISPYRPSAKAAHRADPTVFVTHGAHSAGARLPLLRDWFPIDVGHFPYRTIEQYQRKNARRAHGVHSLGQYVRGYEAQRTGRIDDVFATLVLDDSTVATGVAIGYLAIDTRLRDALRIRDEVGRSRPDPTASDPHARADAAALLEANIVRLFRGVDDLTARVASLEVEDEPFLGRALGAFDRLSPERRVPRLIIRVAATTAVLLALLVGLPEGLGDKPYDPKPSAWPRDVAHHLRLGPIDPGARLAGTPLSMSARP